LALKTRVEHDYEDEDEDEKRRSGFHFA